MPWWTWGVSGLVTLGVGIVVIAEPGNSLKALAVIAGIYLLLDAILAFVALIRHDDTGELSALRAVVSLLIGLLLIRHPIESITWVAIFIGIWLLTVGCLRVVSAFSFDQHRALRIVVGLIQAVAGAVIVAQPHIGYNTLAIIAGISLALQGIAMLALGWTLRGTAHSDAAPPLGAGAATS
jgi:uncharacterized membrane protein HdeD (DUF308 family)